MKAFVDVLLKREDYGINRIIVEMLRRPVTTLDEREEDLGFLNIYIYSLVALSASSKPADFSSWWYYITFSRNQMWMLLQPTAHTPLFMPLFRARWSLLLFFSLSFFEGWMWRALNVCLTSLSLSLSLCVKNVSLSSQILLHPPPLPPFPFIFILHHLCWCSFIFTYRKDTGSIP